MVVSGSALGAASGPLSGFLRGRPGFFGSATARGSSAASATESKLFRGRPRFFGSEASAGDSAGDSAAVSRLFRGRPRFFGSAGASSFSPAVVVPFCALGRDFFAGFRAVSRSDAFSTASEASASGPRFRFLIAVPGACFVSATVRERQCRKAYHINET